MWGGILPDSGGVKLLLELLLWTAWIGVSFKAADADEPLVFQALLLCAVSVPALVVMGACHDMSLNGKVFSDYIPFIHVPSVFLWFLWEAGTYMSREEMICLAYIGAWGNMFAASCIGGYLKSVFQKRRSRDTL